MAAFLSFLSAALTQVAEGALWAASVYLSGRIGK